MKSSQYEILFDDSRRAWLDQARRTARRVAFERGTVTADDIYDECPPPGYLDGRIVGRVFQGFPVIGMTKSKRKNTHFSRICIFGPPAVETQREENQ